MRVLLIDIETSPSMAYVWSLWDQTVPLARLESEGEVICFAAKWLGERKIEFWSAYHHGKEVMVGAAHDLLDEADVVVHYNGERFDIPHLNREFLLQGLWPPAPYKQIDLFRTVKRRFKFVSSKLAHVSERLGIGAKAETGGFDLWRKCMAGDAKAWREMERYNKQDVRLLESLYAELQPWIPSHPHRALYDGTSGCPACGSEHLQRRGFSYTAVSKFQQWQCQDCGAWLRSPKKDAGAKYRQVAG